MVENSSHAQTTRSKTCATDAIDRRHVIEVTHMPPSVVTCPACKHDKCVRASIEPYWMDDPRPSQLVIEGAAYWRPGRGTKLINGSRFYCCLRCGLAWNFVDRAELAGALKKMGVAEGEVPVRASYLIHLIKWVSFIVVTLSLALWLAVASS